MRQKKLPDKLSSRRWRLIWEHLTDRDTPERKKYISMLAQDLASHVGTSCRVLSYYFQRTHYSRDLARVPSLVEKALFRTTPFLVVQPNNERDIAQILSFCKSRRLAVYPRGTASFAFGGAVPTMGGIVMDLSPMMAILEVNPEGLSIRVQPGARWADLAAELEPYGLIPVTTPTSRFSTVGGWVATGGMGLESYGYGHLSESVLGIRLARTDGTIETLAAQSESIEDLFGTEGQFGIMTEITLRVRPRPQYSGAYLLAFDNPEQALGWVAKLDNNPVRPSHVVFFDAQYMKEENTLFSEQTGKPEPIVPEREAVLLHFDNPESEHKFLSTSHGIEDQVQKHKLAARYLWFDRYFPLKAQRLSPGLLGTEVVIPGSKTPRYIRKVRRLTRRFNIKPTTEVIVCRSETKSSHLVILSFKCDYSRKFHYVLCLLLIQLLVRLAVRFKGHPYGVGIWNTPFVGSKYTKNRLAELARKKHVIDPEGILNPHKFFKVNGRFLGITALFLQPLPFRTILAISHFFSPVLGLAARLLGPKPSDGWDVPAGETRQGKSLLHQSSERCTSCGSCVSVCPAYHITKDELVTGRAKLRMAEAMMNGGELEQIEAYSSFRCLHCGLCEEVCQTRLPLRDCYLVLEDWIAQRFGAPDETVQEFVEKLDRNRDYIQNVFGLDLPEWAPGDKFARVPTAEPMREKGKA